MEPGIETGPIEIWQSMGIVGKLVFCWLLLMSTHSITVMIDRLVAFRRARRQTREYLTVAQEAIDQGNLDASIGFAQRYPDSHIARLHETAIRELRSYPGDPPPGFEGPLGRALERESSVVAQDLKRGLPVLASIGATAPFVGLFGTVVGIMNAFFGMAKAGQGGIGAVAGGVAEALVNTAVGIFVALPAVWAFNFFLGRVEGFNVEMRNTTGELKDHFLKRLAR